VNNILNSPERGTPNKKRKNRTPNVGKKEETQPAKKRGRKTTETEEKPRSRTKEHTLLSLATKELELPWDSESAPPYKPYIYVTEDFDLYTIFHKFAYNHQFTLKTEGLKAFVVTVSLPNLDFEDWKDIPGLEGILTLGVQEQRTFKFVINMPGDMQFDVHTVKKFDKHEYLFGFSCKLVQTNIGTSYTF